MNQVINNSSKRAIVIVIMALLISTILTLIAINKHHIQAMADKGYVEQALPGTTTTIWVKDNARY